ncbi:MAG: HEAT repeat domain-containing protein [Polyangiales bacterium]
MALFGLLGKKSSQLEKQAERATNRRAQAIDRWEAIQALVKMGSEEAVAALLPRFTFYVDPSITDQEEKDAAFEGIVAAGEAAVGPVTAFMRKAESLSWSVRMLERLVDPSAVIEKLLQLLAEMDTEYERDPQRKIQTLVVLEERPGPRTAQAVARFLEDANETVRFHAAGALLAQADAAGHRDALLRCFCAEESVRVRNRILDGFAAAGWDVGDLATQVKARLPGGYTLDAKGIPRRA